MANLSSSESLQQPWSNSQSKNNSQSKTSSHSSQAGKKGGGGAGVGSSNGKRPIKRLPKKPRKSSSIESLDYDDDQDHMDACFKDSDYGKLSPHDPLPLFNLIEVIPASSEALWQQLRRRNLQMPKGPGS